MCFKIIISCVTLPVCAFRVFLSFSCFVVTVVISDMFFYWFSLSLCLLIFNLFVFFTRFNTNFVHRNCGVKRNVLVVIKTKSWSLYLAYVFNLFSTFLDSIVFYCSSFHVILVASCLPFNSLYFAYLCSWKGCFF